MIIWVFVIFGLILGISGWYFILTAKGDIEKLMLAQILNSLGVTLSIVAVLML